MNQGIRFEAQRERWAASTRKRSGNLTTNEFLPSLIRARLLEEDERLAQRLRFEPLDFPSVIPGHSDLDILAGLQRFEKKGNLTFYRAIRFPTLKRIWETVTEQGLSMANYEQERILELYEDPEYVRRRKEIKGNSHFWTQPQERVVNGVPVFFLVNDALQIHRAYRSNPDRVLVDVMHVPLELMRHLELIANTAIDLDLHDETRDFLISDFVEKNGVPAIDYAALRVRGIDVHEMYVRRLPYAIAQHLMLGIEQRFFLLDIHEIDLKDKTYQKLRVDTKLLKENEDFLHGFFGDQNIFGRQPTKYLPHAGYEVKQATDPSPYVK